jgi:hypothetical protein
MRLRRSLNWVTVHGPPVRIVADAAIAAGGIHEGRLIPLVILDTTDRPDLEELIRVHQYISPGDARTQWGVIKGSTHKIALLLSFDRPIELAATLEFDVLKQGVLVDQILATNVIYLQAGREGDRFVKNPTAPKIFLEVPDTGFRDLWDDMFYRHIMKQMRKGGLSRPQAKQAAREYIRQFRDFARSRMIRKMNEVPPRPDDPNSL